jgi:GDP-4-dehydro-6-deoxy-D-mannose reductase
VILLKRILITGHTGFIGQHLVKFLKNKYEIIGISRKSSDEEIINIKKDVRKITLKDIPKKIDCIIHLAGLNDVGYCQENPSKCFDINIEGTQKMLEISRQRNAKFIFVSTSHIYGIPKKLPISETHDRSPLSIYAYSKLNGEILCESYSKNFNLDITIARIFSVYGPNSPKHHVITKIINHFTKNKKLQLGNIYPKRDFIYVQDLITAIDILIKKGNGFNIYNIGRGESNSIKDIVNIISKITKKNAQIETDASKIRKMEIDEICSDTSKIKELGWRPKYDLKRGLEITIKEISKK